MISNIKSSEELVGLYRSKSKYVEIKTIHKADVEEHIANGWIFSRGLSKSVQVKRDKQHGYLLEDRVWTLFYKMGFHSLSDKGGAKLAINPKDPKSITSQIDIVAIDREVALAIECKSALTYRKRPEFQEELAKFGQLRETFIKAIKAISPTDEVKKQPVMLMFLNNINLTDNDKERAKNVNVILFDSKDLEYYESLVSHLGPAAKYQILSDMLPGKEIPGLSIRIPAIRNKMGGYKTYTFSISPEFLLKIAYVSHRSKGKASDVNTYQRMLTKSRLTKIKAYIADDGIFPTNIILNFDKKLNFQKIKQEIETEDDFNIATLGWLDIKATYKSAWIIDGQHRLYAYSGHPKAYKDTLSVVAFEGLKPSKQAELFIDINAKQKSVKLSLLQELYAELHWDSDNIQDRISAIVSKTLQDLGKDPDSPLYDRIQSTDGVKSELKCITLTSLFSQVEKKGFFIAKERNGSVLEYGPLWGGDRNEQTLIRTSSILKFWISTIISKNRIWWDKGSGEGGGLAMNDGVATMLSILKTAFEVLESKGHKPVGYNTEELQELLKPFAEGLGTYLSTLDIGKQKAFRDLRGSAGLIYRTRQCQAGLRSEMSSFNPEGLDEWLNLQKQQTNKNAKELVDDIEVSLQKYIVPELKSNIGIEDDIWWYEGVGQAIRTRVGNRMEEDKNKRGGREFYFDLLDYKKIIDDNWELFGELFGNGTGAKPKKLQWLDFINEIRRIVAHASSGKTVNLEDFNKLNELHRWLKGQISLDSVSFEKTESNDAED